VIPEVISAASLNANIEAGLAKVIQLPRRTADGLYDVRDTVSVWHANGTPAEISREIRALRPGKWLLSSDETEQPQRDSNPCRHLERVVS
jgi:hypothetical protein